MPEADSSSTCWVDFTRRTNDPKLAWIEAELKRRGIPCQRFGRSFHAPILQVPKAHIDAAWAVLDLPFTAPDGGIVLLDNMPDDHPTFTEHKPWDTTSG